MRIRDPEGAELKNILNHTDFNGKNVLEIGCGDGRLTFKYAASAKHVIAIDPSAENIVKATEQIPQDLKTKLEFRQENGEHLPFANDSFDVVFFTYSLCCFSSKDSMKKGVDEAWRVLVPDGGILVNLQPCLHQPFKGNRGSILYLISRKPKDLVNYDGGDWNEKKQYSLYTIKNATLYERKFDLMVDEMFTRNTYYDTVEEVLEEAGIELGGPLDTSLDVQTYNEIQKITETLKTPKGILLRNNVVMSILRKLRED